MPWISGAIIAGGAIIGGMQSNRAADKRQGLNYEQQKEFAQNAVQWRTEDAQAAGVHPLYAMGASTTSFQPSFETGSGSGDAIRGAARGISKAREDFLEAQTENTKAKTAQIAANARQDLVLPMIDAQKQEIEKGRVQPHSKAFREQNTSVLSPMTQFRIGSQNVWLPIEEMDQLMEDPAAVALAAYNYRGNKNVNWMKLGQDYTGKKLGGTLAKRNPKAFKSGAKFKAMLMKNAKKTRRSKVENTFFKRKRRQPRGY